ncbi:MAG: hypothetical protein BWY76_02308 [bacterium ADurb.Bin429]|nr:MAG: hypothetical protein BWY76_02308 [bacterium ADurb.Bin429]
MLDRITAPLRRFRCQRIPVVLPKVQFDQAHLVKDGQLCRIAIRAVDDLSRQFAEFLRVVALRAIRELRVNRKMPVGELRVASQPHRHGGRQRFDDGFHFVVRDRDIASDVRQLHAGVNIRDGGAEGGVARCHPVKLIRAVNRHASAHGTRALKDKLLADNPLLWRFRELIFAHPGRNAGITVTGKWVQPHAGCRTGVHGGQHGCFRFRWMVRRAQRLAVCPLPALVCVIGARAPEQIRRRVAVDRHRHDGLASARPVGAADINHLFETDADVAAAEEVEAPARHLTVRAGARQRIHVKWLHQRSADDDQWGDAHADEQGPYQQATLEAGGDVLIEPLQVMLVADKEDSGREVGQHGADHPSGNALLLDAGRDDGEQEDDDAGNGRLQHVLGSEDEEGAAGGEEHEHEEHCLKLRPAVAGHGGHDRIRPVYLKTGMIAHERPGEHQQRNQHEQV